MIKDGVIAFGSLSAWKARLEGGREMESSGKRAHF